MPYQQQYAPQQQFQYVQKRPRNPKRQFDPLPISYGQILPYMIKSGFVVPKQLKPILPSYLLGYDINTKCDFHAGEPRHTVDNCKDLKYKVQDLIDSKEIYFTPCDPNVKNNHMPTHAESSVNIIK